MMRTNRNVSFRTLLVLYTWRQIVHYNPYPSRYKYLNYFGTVKGSGSGSGKRVISKMPKNNHILFLLFLFVLTFTTTSCTSYRNYSLTFDIFQTNDFNVLKTIEIRLIL